MEGREISGQEKTKKMLQAREKQVFKDR